MQDGPLEQENRDADPPARRPSRRARRSRNRRRRRPGPATVAFAVPLAAFAYFLAAPALPALGAGDPTVLVAGGIGLLMVAASTLALLPARETLIGPLLIVLGSGLLVAALNSASVGAGANVFEAFLAGCAGLLFARWLAAPIVAVAVPLFVAAIDVWSVASGPSSRLLAGGTDSVDALSFDLPAWGHMGSAGHLGLSDALFVSMFAAWAWRYDLRRWWTLGGITLGLIGSLVLGVALDRAIPAIPLIAAGYLLANLDRLGRLLHPEGQVE
ncbi:MAG TPA: hypothetical protein VF526_11535 [Solirubrobacteraceae bacterium]